MPSLLYGAITYSNVPVDENTVRNTATPVEHDAPAAMAESAPDMGEVETDHNPHLGLVNRQVASKVGGGQKFIPPWLGEVNSNADHNDIVNRQVSSSGTAAAREAAGQWGHGTAVYAEGIEPVGDLRDGGKMGNDYFAAHDPAIQHTAGDYMTPGPGQDHTVPAMVAGVGKVNARAAANSAYNVWYNGGGH